MPRGDGTGPRGLGAMTGRAAGYCAGVGVPGYANRGNGWAGPGGAGFGGGRGRRRMFYATGQPGWMRFGGGPTPGRPDPGWERQVLEGQAKALQSELDAVKRRLSEMETQAST